jgi:hypothetical protein
VSVVLIWSGDPSPTRVDDVPFAAIRTSACVESALGRGARSSGTEAELEQSLSGGWTMTLRSTAESTEVFKPCSSALVSFCSIS